jgi:hypothetical protein
VNLRLFRSVCVALGLLYVLTLNNLLSSGGDNARYIVLAKALAVGHGMRLGDVPGAPFFVKLPPLWPLVLAPLAGVAPDAWWLMKLAAVLSLFAGLWVGLRLLDRAYGSAVARWAVVLSLLSPWVYEYAHDVRPEMLYLLLSFAALALAMRESDVTGPSNGTAIAAGALGAGAYLTRNIGLAVVAAMVLGLWLAHQRRPAALVALTALALALPWQLYFAWAQAQSPDGPSYVSDFLLRDPYSPALGRASVGELALRIAAGVPSTLAGLAEVVFYVPAKLAGSIGASEWLLAVVGLVVLVLYGLGLWTSFRRTWRTTAAILPLYELVYWAVVLIWPFTGPKFIVPIIPLIWGRVLWQARAVISGLAVRGRWPERRRRGVSGGALAVVLLCSAPGLARSMANDLARRQEPALDRYEAAARWLRDHAPADAVVMARKTDLLALVSRRQVTNVPLYRDADMYREHLAHDGVTYAVVDALGFPGTREYLQWYIEGHPAAFEPVYETGAPITRVYRYRGP